MYDCVPGRTVLSREIIRQTVPLCTSDFRVLGECIKTLASILTSSSPKSQVKFMNRGSPRRCPALDLS